MANAKKNQKAAANEVAAETTAVQAVEVEQNEVAAEAPAEATEDVVDQAPEKAKRERNYSQTAVDNADLERLNQLKTFVKEKLNVTISNQRIIAAALDCLGDNTEAFLKGIAEEANNKQLAKERKTYEALRAKFEAMTPPTEDATEEVVEATEEAAAAE